MSAKRIIGIDPGSRFTGIGIIDLINQTTVYVHHETIKCINDEFPLRLKTIFEGISNIIDEYKPNCASIESVFMGKNASAALKLGQARGAAISACVAKSIDVSEYAPRAIKQAIVGKGSADKKQIEFMVRALLSLKEPIQNDAADGLAIAICHSNSLWAQNQFSGNNTTKWNKL